MLFGCCCSTPANVTLHALGCNSLDLPGATVTFSRTGFAPVTGTTGGTGRVTVALANGVWSWSVAQSRFTTKTGGVTATSTLQTVTTTPLTPTSSYICQGGCALPFARTLFLTNAFGTFTLTYNTFLTQWQGSWSWTNPSGIVLNGGSCGSGTVSILIVFGNPSISYTASATSGACSGTPGMWDVGHSGSTTTAAFAGATATAVCPPSLSWTAANPTWTLTISGGFSGTWTGAAPVIGTSTLTE